ncbi:MAG TPA: type IV secretion system DNA-binding domain-containing protein [Allosphingosinicella sp.]
MEDIPRSAPTIFSPTGLLLLAALLIVAWQFKHLRPAIMFALRLVPALILFVVGLAATILWKPVGWLADRLAPILSVDEVAERVLERGGQASADPLLLDDRRAAAESVWPPADYPDLYQQVPEDMERPPYEDGRLLGGVGVVWLADRFMTETAFRSAVRGGFKAALVVFVAILIVLLLRVFSGVLAFIPALLEGERPIVEQWPGAEPEKISTLWLLGANFGSAFAELAGNIVSFIVSVLAAIPLAAGAGIVVALLLLTSWMRAKSEPYRLVTKDADVRWAYRSETRALLRQTFRRQIHHAAAYLKGAATYSVGVATGALRARGDLAAPLPSQPVKLDRESLFQHLLVFGGTGEGKTTALLKPLLRQVLADSNFGAFIADAKGVLWRDAQKLAHACGRGDDVVVIGTGPEQVGFDPIASLTPTQVAATLRSVLRQTSGEASDSFWPEMAANVIRHALTIGRAYARTAEGRDEFARTGVSPYSLWWAYRAIILPDTKSRPGPLSNAVSHLRRQFETDREAHLAATGQGDAAAAEEIAKAATEIYTPEYESSLEYMEGAWRDMATETRTGIIASVTQLLDGFSGARVLRERFASGRDSGIADLRAALDGKIILNALSSIEDGLPARLTSILIKTALYREARVREAEWKRDHSDRSPQDRPCLVVMDEVQELATVDPASGLSDASFWNVARSSGLAGLFATQTVAALVQAMGREAADNFIQQARSKIFFRTEDKDTVDYACWCAGEYERNRVYDDEHRESIEYRGLIDGWNPLSPVDESEEIAAGPRAFFDAAAGLINPNRIAVAAPTAKPAFDVDARFIASDAVPGQGGGIAGNAARMGSTQAAVWRSEDLTRQYRMQGNVREPALAPADMIHMGRWHAFAHVQRAGAVRQDIIRVEHDFN